MSSQTPPPAMSSAAERVAQPPRGGMSGVDEHTVLDGERSWRHDEGGGMGRLGAKESETWMSDEGCSRKRELQGGDEQENAESTAYLNLRNARNMYCILEDFFELVGGSKRQGKAITLAAPRSQWLLMRQFFISMSPCHPTVPQQLVDELHGRGAHVLAEHVAKLLQGDGTRVSAGGAIGPSISPGGVYGHLEDVKPGESRVQWHLQCLESRLDSVAWWISMMEVAGRFRSRAESVPVVSWNVGPVGFMNSCDQIRLLLEAKPAVLCLQDIRVARQDKEGIKKWIESRFPYKAFISIAGKAVHGRRNGATHTYWMGILTCISTLAFRGGRGFTLETTSSRRRRSRHAADGRALIVCATPHKGPEVTVYNIYQHTADNASRREELWSQVRQHIEKTRGRKLLMGDLNASPHLRRGYSCRTTGRRDAADKDLTAFVRDTGADWRPVNGPTWSSPTGPQKAALDHILTWGLNYEREPEASWLGVNLSSNPAAHNTSHDHIPVHASIRMDGGSWQQPAHPAQGYRFDAARFESVREAWTEKCQRHLPQPPLVALTGPALADRFQQESEILKKCAQDCLESLFPRSNRARERRPGRSKEQALLTKEINALSTALREASRGDGGDNVALSRSARTACILGGLGAYGDDRLRPIMRHPVWIAEMSRLRSVRQHRLAAIARQQMTSNLNRAKAKVRALFAHGVKGIQKARGKRGGLPQATEVQQALVIGVQWRVQNSVAEVQVADFLATKPASLSVACAFPKDDSKQTHWSITVIQVEDAGALLQWIGTRHPAGCDPEPKLVSSNGPWKGKDLPHATAAFFHKNAMHPFANCPECGHRDMCSEAQPADAAVTGHAPAKSEVRRIMRTVCGACLCATDFRHNRTEVPDMEFLAKAGVFSYRTVPSGTSVRKPVTWRFFNRALGRMASKKAWGPDEVPAELLKFAPISVKRVLRDLINGLLSGEVAPTVTMMQAKVVLLYKKNDPSVLSNFRPIALINAVYQLLNMILKMRYQRIAEAHMVLETPQYGNRSCRGVPLPFQKMVWLAEYAQKQGRVLLRTDIDLVNFFNSVNHSCMFAVMREFGFPDVDLLESLYNNASMVIVTPEGDSPVISMDTGTVQGSALSPLLSEIFLNALLRYLTLSNVSHGVAGVSTGNQSAFVDDVSTYTPGTPGAQELLGRVQEFERWCGTRVSVPKSLVTGVNASAILPKPKKRQKTQRNARSGVTDSQTHTDSAETIGLDESLEVELDSVPTEELMGAGRQSQRRCQWCSARLGSEASGLCQPCSTSWKPQPLEYGGEKLASHPGAEPIRLLGIRASMTGSMHAQILHTFSQAALVLQELSSRMLSVAQKHYIVGVTLPAALAFPEGTVMWPEDMLNKLRKVWHRAYRLAWELTLSASATPLCFPANRGGMQTPDPLSVLCQAFWRHLRRCFEQDDMVGELMHRKLQDALREFHCNNLEELQEEVALYSWKECMKNQIAYACMLAHRLRIRVHWDVDKITVISRTSDEDLARWLCSKGAWIKIDDGTLARCVRHALAQCEQLSNLPKGVTDDPVPDPVRMEASPLDERAGAQQVGNSSAHFRTSGQGKAWVVQVEPLSSKEARMRCPPYTCFRDPVRQIAGERISWARAEEEFQVFDRATNWGPSSGRSRSDRIRHALELECDVPARILALEQAFPELAQLLPVGNHRPPPLWFPVSWVSSCPQLPPVRQMLRELHPQIRCLEDLEHAMPHAPVPREITTDTSSEPASSVARGPADDGYVSDESSTTDSTHPRVVTPPEATSQYDFDIQLGSGERFTCRVESQGARSDWIQAIEVARSSATGEGRADDGIPDCPLHGPTDPPSLRATLARWWSLRYTVDSDGDCGTGRECTRAAGGMSPDVNGDSGSEVVDVRADGNGDDGSDDDEVYASHEGRVHWRSCNAEGGSDFSEVWMQVKGSNIRWYDKEMDGIPIRRTRATALITQSTRVTATISCEWGRHRDTRQAQPQADPDDGNDDMAHDTTLAFPVADDALPAISHQPRHQERGTMGLSWARLTFPLRMQRKNLDLAFRKALDNLRKASNTDEHAVSQQCRIREAQQKLPLDLYRQLRKGENAFWALLPALKAAGFTSADSLPCELTASRYRLMLPAYGPPARRAEAQAWLDMLRLSDSSEVIRRKANAAQQVLPFKPIRSVTVELAGTRPSTTDGGQLIQWVMDSEDNAEAVRRWGEVHSGTAATFPAGTLSQDVECALHEQDWRDRLRRIIQTLVRDGCQNHAPRRNGRKVPPSHAGSAQPEDLGDRLVEEVIEMRHAQTCYKSGRTTRVAQDIRGFFPGGEDAKLEFKIRVAACTQDRISALLNMPDAKLRDSLIRGRDIIWLPQSGWPEMKARKWKGWWVVAMQSERMVICGGGCGQTFSIEGPPGACRGRPVSMREGPKTWVCYECRGDRKRKHSPQDQESDPEDHTREVDGKVRQQIQIGLVVRTADPTLLGVDGMQDTMLSCETIRRYLQDMRANYQKQGDRWREDWVTSEEVGYKLRDQINRGEECLACLTNKEEGDHLILCDGCGHGFHLECLGLMTTPPGVWLCPWCVGESEAFPTDVCRAHPLRYLHPAMAQFLHEAAQTDPRWDQLFPASVSRQDATGLQELARRNLARDSLGLRTRTEDYTLAPEAHDPPPLMGPTTEELSHHQRGDEPLLHCPCEQLGGGVATIRESRRRQCDIVGASVSLFEGCATITDSLTTFQLDSARWLFLHSLMGAHLQEEFSTKVHEWTQLQQRREARSQYHSFTWQVLRAAADSIGAKTLCGASPLTFPPFFSTVESSEQLLRGMDHPEGAPAIITLDDMDGLQDDDPSCLERFINKSSKWIALTAPWPDDTEVSRCLRAKGHFAFTEQGYTRRVKGWWREGSIKSRRSSGVQVWTSWDTNEDGQGLEHLRSVIKDSTDKDSPAWDEVKQDVAFWGGTETGLLGLLTTNDQVFACDGSLADSALGGGAFCLTTGQFRYAKVAEGQDTDSSARAEILAAIIAVNWCLDPSLDIGTPSWIYDCTPKVRSDTGTRRVVILTDCQVLLDTVEKWTDEGPRPSLRNRPNGDLLDILFRKLHAATASDILTVFVKVKAHRGDPANELADAAADLGRTDGVLVQPSVWPQLMYSLRPSEDGVDAATDLRPRRAGQGTKKLFAKQAALLCAEQAKGACADWFRRQGQYRSGLAAYLTDRGVPERARRRLLQSVSRTFPCQQWLAMARIKESADCPHCLRHSVSCRETMGHIQCVCPSLERARIAAHHHIWRSLLAMLAASSQPTLVPSGTRWMLRTGRPTGVAINDADFLTRLKQGQGMVALTEAERAGQFSSRQLAEGVYIRDGGSHWVPADDTEVEWSFPTATSPTAHVEWTASQILLHLQAPLTDEQLRQRAANCVGKESCGDAACAAVGCRYAPHIAESREEDMDTEDAPPPRPPLRGDERDDGREGGPGREQDHADSPPPPHVPCCDRVTQLLKQRPDGVAFNHGLKKVLILEFTRAYDKLEDWADTTEAYKTARYIPLLQLLRQILGPLGWEIAQANFTVGVWGSIPESRFDGSLAALGVPRPKVSSIRARCSRAALDMHEFMLQCYYQIRGRNADRLQVDKAMLTSTPLGGIVRLPPHHVISR